MWSPFAAFKEEFLWLNRCVVRDEKSFSSARFTIVLVILE